MKRILTVDRWCHRVPPGVVGRLARAASPPRRVPGCWRSSRPAASSITSCSRSRRCGPSRPGPRDGGYAFAATTDWDDLNDANLRDVRLVIWLNDMPRTPAQRQAFERYMTGGGAWLGFHVSGFGNNAWPWFTEFMGGSRFTASNWPSLPARVNVDDAAHPIVEGVPPTFVAPINEWYSWTPSPRAQSRRQGAADAGRSRTSRSA